MNGNDDRSPNRFINWFSVEGFVAVVVVITAVALSILQLISVISLEKEQLIALGITVLGILTTFELTNTIKLIGQARALQTIAERDKKADLPKMVIRERGHRPSLEDFFNGAKRIIICDAFSSSIRIEIPLLVRLIQRRCDVAVVVLNPSNKLVLQKMANLSSLESEETLRSTLQTSIDSFKIVAQLYKYNSSGEVLIDSQFDLSYSNTFIPFAGIFVEKFNGQEKILIELYPYKYDELKVYQHHFILDGKDTPKLFVTYKESLLSLFQESEKQNLNPSITTISGEKS